jgi:peptide chain release factor subunit 1
LLVHEGLIRELAGFTGSKAPVVSLYLDVDGRRFVRTQDLEPHVDALVRRAREQAQSAGLTRHAMSSVEADLARIGEYVRFGLDRSGTRGLVVFACTAHGLWRVVELGVPVRNRMVVNHSPYVRELESVLVHSERLAVLLADRQRARLLLVRQGQVVDRTEHTDLLPRHDDDKGELTRDQVAGHAAAAAHRHLRRAAEIAFGAFRDPGFDHLALGGPEEVVAALERELHPYLRERIVARLSLPVAVGEDEIRKAAAEIEAGVERAREARLVARLRGALGAGSGAVAGLQATLDALVARRVATLLVSDGYEAPGWRCPSCAYIGARGRACPVCATNMELVDDVVETAVEEALAQACQVVPCRDADLDVLGRIGALLRY